MKRGKSLALALLLILLMVALLSNNAGAVTSNEIREQIDALEKKEDSLQQEIELLESQLEKNYEQISAIVSEKAQLDNQIALLYEQIENNDAQIRAYTRLIADTQDDLEKAEADLAALNHKYIDRIRAMEEQSDISYWSVLFRASSLADFLDRLNMIEEIAASDNRRLQELRGAAQLVSEIKSALEKDKSELVKKRADLEVTGKLLDEKREESDVLLRLLISKGNEFSQLLAESEKKQNELMEEIAQMENAYDKKAEEEWLATSVPETTNAPHLSGGQPQADGVKWICPVEAYTLGSPFGMRFHPLLGIWRMHNGIDMSCPMDTPIYATRSGVISVTGNQEYGAGIYVQINHGDGYRSIYMHMTRYVVSLGQSVEAGELIGYVGSTGLSSGPHLHFGISYNGTYVNPVEYLP